MKMKNPIPEKTIASVETNELVSEALSGAFSAAAACGLLVAASGFTTTGSVGLVFLGGAGLLI